jgi:anti-anti-sigma factor
MKISIQKAAGIAVVSLSGRIDAVSAPDFERQVSNEIQGGEDRWVFDFSGIDYISSAGLRSLLFLAKQMKGRGARLELCCLKGMVKEVFDLSGFTSMFSISESVEEAGRKISG